MDEVAIKVDNVSKDFRYTSGRSGTIKSLVTGMFKDKDAVDKDIQHALKNISFEVKKGEFFGIVGRNGSGKSTLLKMIAGIYQPNKGGIQVNGKLVPFIELGVGFNPELTGRENVYLNGALLGFSRKEVEAQYDEIVEFAELGKFMDQQLKNYSSGMQVRLAFSMAVRAKADILLIDEVLAVGDADFQRKCFSYFNQLKKDKATVILVTHDMEAVREYCDSAMLIEDSRLVMKGKTEAVAQEYIKLFSGQSAQVAEQGQKWGDGKAVVSKLKVNVTKDTIVITESVSVHEDLDGLVLGIRIRNEAGQHLAGANTKQLSKKITNVASGDKLEVVWEIANVLSDGAYYLDYAVQHLDAIGVHEWQDGAHKFVIKKDRKSTYPVDPKITVEVQKAA